METRYVVVSAGREGKAGQPLFVLAQDGDGVLIAPIAQDLIEAAERIGLAAMTYVDWLAELTAAVRPLRVWSSQRRTYETLALSDPGWLEVFLALHPCEDVVCSPVRTRSGPALAVVRSLLSQNDLAPCPSRPTAGARRHRHTVTGDLAQGAARRLGHHVQSIA